MFQVSQDPPPLSMYSTPRLLPSGITDFHSVILCPPFIAIHHVLWFNCVCDFVSDLLCLLQRNAFYSWFEAKEEMEFDFCSVPAALFNAPPSPACAERHRRPREPFTYESWHAYESVSQGCSDLRDELSVRVCTLSRHLQEKQRYMLGTFRVSFADVQECVFMCVYERVRLHLLLESAFRHTHASTHSFNWL